MSSVSQGRLHPSTGLVTSARPISLGWDLGERRSGREQQRLRRPGCLKKNDCARSYGAAPRADIAPPRGFRHHGNKTFGTAPVMGFFWRIAVFISGASLLQAC